MKTQTRQITAIVLTALFLAHPASAKIIAPGKISTPYVKKGEATLEARGGYAFNYDDGNYLWENRLGVGYGLTDYLRIEADGRTGASKGQGSEYTATSFAAKFQLTPKDAYFADLGLKLTYILADDPGASDQIDIRLLAGKEIGTWKLGFNYKLSRDVGHDSTDKWSSGLSAGAYKSFGQFFTGPEYFVDFGQFHDHQSFEEQSHYIGEQVGYKFQLPDGKSLGLKLDYYQGITSAAADSTFRYQIDYAF